MAKSTKLSRRASISMERKSSPHHNSQIVVYSPSRRDGTLLTVGFSLRPGYAHPPTKSRRDDTCLTVLQKAEATVNKVSSLRDLVVSGMFLYRRLKPTVNKVSSLRDLVGDGDTCRRLQSNVIKLRHTKLFYNYLNSIGINPVRVYGSRWNPCSIDIDALRAIFVVNQDCSIQEPGLTDSLKVLILAISVLGSRRLSRFLVPVCRHDSRKF